MYHLQTTLAVMAVTALNLTTAQSYPPYVNPWGTAMISFLSPGSQESWEVVLDGTPFYPHIEESISWLSTPSTLINIKDHCVLETIDGQSTLQDIGGNYFALGPPQVIISITCINPTLSYREKSKREQRNSKREMEKREGEEVDEKRNIPIYPSALISFHGAADAEFLLGVRYDGVPTVVGDYPVTKISVSQIASKFIDVMRYCKVVTKDSVGPLMDLGPGRWQLSPPTQIVSVTCNCPAAWSGGSCL